MNFKKALVVFATATSIATLCGGFIGASIAHASEHKVSSSTARHDEVRTAFHMKKFIEEKGGNSEIYQKDFLEIAQKENNGEFVQLVKVKEIPGWTIEVVGSPNSFSIYVNEAWVNEKEDVAEAVRIGKAKIRNKIFLKKQAQF